MEEKQAMKQHLRQIFKYVIETVNPRRLIRSSVTVESGKLLCLDSQFELNKDYYVVGFGKAVYEMCTELLQIMPTKAKRGILSVPVGTLSGRKPPDEMENFQIFEGAKDNIPDKNCEAAAKAVIELAKQLTETDFLIVLISGGGSALLACPISPVTLEEKVMVTKLVARAGGNIQELNCVRKNFSLIKGGKLAQFAYPAQLVSLILSDVVGNELQTIASGPTVPSDDTRKKAISVLKKFSLINKVPSSVITVLNTEDVQIPNEIFDKSSVKIIGSNTIALNEAGKLLDSEGKTNFIMSDSIQGQLEDIAPHLCVFTKYICQLLTNEMRFDQFEAVTKRLFLILSVENKSAEKLLLFLKEKSSKIKEIYFFFGGETTVNVIGRGIGGRNMELALRFSSEIDASLGSNTSKFDVLLLSGGTDGIDGPTDAAGAIGYNGLPSEARRQRLNVDAYIQENDSYNFYDTFKNGEEMIITGLTGTNVMDVIILYIKKLQTSEPP